VRDAAVSKIGPDGVRSFARDGGLFERALLCEPGAADQQSLLQGLSHIAQHAFVTNTDLLLAKYTHLLLQWNPQMVSASVTDLNGRIRAHSEPRRIGQTLEAQPPAPAYALTLSQPVRLGVHTFGTASITFSQQLLDGALQERFGELRQRIVTVALLALLVGWALCWWMALSWTRPIGRLERAFQQIGRGDWDIDLGLLTRRRDEVGFLSRGCLAMAGQLAQLDQLKDDFVAAVSHELRSPMGAIGSYLDRIEDLRNNGEPLEAWPDFIAPIRTSCQRLERFVDDLLDVAYYETGKLHLDRRSTDIAQLAAEVLNLFQFKLQEKHITYDLRVPVPLPKVYIDPERIRQVLTNLVSNAMKFTLEGGHMEVRIEPDDARKGLRVTVKDNGIGIAPMDQARIFNKFEQVKSTRTKVAGAKGTGLGLAISRALVELHGGTIGVNSESGKGSEFFFTLPVTLSPAGAAVP